MTVDEFSCGVRYFRDHAEYRRWFEILAISFSEWYGSRDPGWSLSENRHVANCRAALFPDFHHQLRSADGRAVGYLATVPGYWSGDADSLQNFDHVAEALDLPRGKLLLCTAAHVVLNEWLRSPGLFERFARKVRGRRQAGANAVLLLSMSVEPDHRKHRLPGQMLAAARSAARNLGYSYVAAPFRPSHYGQFKSQRRAAHSEALFAEYCRSLDADGLPRDPWLRNVVRQGARLVKPEARSLAVRRSLARFEAFRKVHRPDDWYSPAPDVWECGETCTWYVDRVRRLVTSWEPNCWGVIDVEPVVPSPSCAPGVQDARDPLPAAI